MLRKHSVKKIINLAISELLNTDGSVFLLGEEIGANNGIYGITSNLQKKYGEDRIIDMPICEAGFTGMAIGAAINRLYPIVEYMNWSFSYQAVDQILNSAAKIEYITNGKIRLNMILRGPHGYYLGGGPEHTNDFSTFFSRCSFLTVIAPYSCEDHFIAYKQAKKIGGVFIILENIQLYDMKFEIPLNMKTTLSSYVYRKGEHVTIASYSHGMHIAEKVTDELENYGILGEIVNILTVHPINYDAIISSVIRTGFLLIIDIAPKKCSVANEISNFIYENYPSILKRKIEKHNISNDPIPFSSNNDIIPCPIKIAKEIQMIIKEN